MALTIISSTISKVFYSGIKQYASSARPYLQRERERSQGMHKSKIVQPRTNFEAFFKVKYSHLVKELENVAEEEICTVDEQIIYTIKNYLSNA